MLELSVEVLGGAFWRAVYLPKFIWEVSTWNQKWNDIGRYQLNTKNEGHQGDKFSEKAEES